MAKIKLPLELGSGPIQKESTVSNLTSIFQFVIAWMEKGLKKVLGGLLKVGARKKRIKFFPNFKETKKRAMTEPVKEIMQAKKSNIPFLQTHSGIMDGDAGG